MGPGIFEPVEFAGELVTSRLQPVSVEVIRRRLQDRRFIVLGIIGSFVGGFLGYVLFNKDVQSGALQPSGIIGSIVGSVIALLVYRAVNGRRSVTA